jgi:uncharacterized protein
MTSGLAMKAECEKCAVSLGLSSQAYICSYECTFCRACSNALVFVCPNCGGELVRRPSRATAATCPTEGGTSP